MDYLLRAFTETHGHPLTLAFVEAKKEKLPPTPGLEQVKEYARRHAVKFVYSANGRLFVEYDVSTGKTTDPRQGRSSSSPTRRCAKCVGCGARSGTFKTLQTKVVMATTVFDKISWNYQYDR